MHGQGSAGGLRRWAACPFAVRRAIRRSPSRRRMASRPAVWYKGAVAGSGSRDRLARSGVEMSAKARQVGLAEGVTRHPAATRASFHVGLRCANPTHASLRRLPWVPTEQTCRIGSTKVEPARRPPLSRPRSPAVRPRPARRPLRPDHPAAPARQVQARGPLAADAAAPQAGDALLHPAVHAHVPVVRQRLSPAGDPHERDPRPVHLLGGEGGDVRGQHPHVQLLRRRDHHAYPRGGNGGPVRGADGSHRAAGPDRQRRKRQGSAPDPGTARHLHPGAQLRAPGRHRRQDHRPDGRPASRPHRALPRLPHEELPRRPAGVHRAGRLRDGRRHQGTPARARLSPSTRRRS